MNDYLLACTRRQRIAQAKLCMKQHFETLDSCAWDNCNYRFRDKSIDAYTTYIDNHLKRMRLHYCLWSFCGRAFTSAQKLARHVSEAYDVPNAGTIPTKHYYCYEYDTWCLSQDLWRQHILLDHFPHLNDYCGLLRIGGVVLIPALCLFCLGDGNRTLVDRFAQFPDVNKLHLHMKLHLDVGYGRTVQKRGRRLLY
jgi:hypothetical protein